MLLITHAGMTVNLAHVASIQSRTEEEALNVPARSNKEDTPMRLLLVLAGGDSVVAARDLPPAACRFLREAITRAWADGMALTDARDLLKRYGEGAYMAVSTTETQPTL